MTAPHSSSQPRQVLLAACFGTFLEWYDFLTFATLATYFGPLFFPPEHPTTGLLASLATFGAGMVVRPLGAALFGSLGDRLGRRKIFILTIVLMGLATVGVGLLPTYGQVGLAAPLGLLALRLLQGLSVGGEIGGSAVYVTEHAAPEARGRLTSVLQLMGPLGMMVSTLQVVLLQHSLTTTDFQQWGWRVPFLLSALLLVLSLKSRIALHESPVFRQLAREQRLSATPLRDCLGDGETRKRMALLFLCISSGGSLLFFSAQVYSTVFLKTVVGLESSHASALVLAATLALFPLTVACGALSDRIGRRPVLLAGLLVGAVGLLPVFAGLLQIGNPDLARFNAQALVRLQGPDCGPTLWPGEHNTCRPFRESLAQLGVAYDTAPAPHPVLTIGRQQLSSPDPAAIKAALKTAGWPGPQAAGGSDALLFLLLLIPILAVALITGPQTAVLAELFPARFRYSAVALPHNLAAGWIGGLSPFLVTLINVESGQPLAGLIYPSLFLALALGVGLKYLPETRGVDLGR